MREKKSTWTQFSFSICCGVFHLQRKIELLEQKLLEEQHERKLVQEKAEEVKQKRGKIANILKK